MWAQQKQVLESCQRVRAWVQAHLDDGLAPLAERLAAEYDAAVARAERALVHQASGQRLARAGTQELRAAVRRLRERHLKPIAVIARASSHLIPGLERACRTPRHKLPLTPLLAEATAVAGVVRPHKEWFVFHGRRPGFVEELLQAVAELERIRQRRTRAEGLHVGATAALKRHLSRARQLVEVLDCVVRAVYEGDEVRIAEWDTAKRVREKSGARAEGNDSMGVDGQTRAVAELSIAA